MMNINEKPARSSIMTDLKKIRFIMLMMIAAAFFAACASTPSFRVDGDPALIKKLRKAPDYPPVKFICFSDPHLYDPSLGVNGPAFQRYLEKDRKLLKQSTEILETAIQKIAAMDGRFVIVPGDMTKDGTYQSHVLFAAYCKKIAAGGKPVFVIPGNHDISNPEAFSYQGNKKILVKGVGPKDFKKIYADFGYKQALYQDPNSQSYIVSPVKGLWLFALDACLYAQNPERGKGHSITDGKFNAMTLAWLEKHLQLAAEKNIAVMAMMHHGILEHYRGQEKHFGEYLVDDFQRVSRMLAQYNVRIVFTGHHHAQDIVYQKWPDGKFLFDIQTGSLVTYPCPLRELSIDAGQTLTVRSTMITSIPSMGDRFFPFAKKYVRSGIEGIARKVMEKYGCTEKDRDILAPQIADVMVAHYEGDENITAATRDQGLSFMGGLVMMTRRDLIEGLKKDTPPPDNHVRIDLRSGAWK